MNDPQPSALAQWFADEAGVPLSQWADPSAALSDLLIARPARPIPSDIDASLHQWYDVLSSRRPVTAVDRLETFCKGVPAGSDGHAGSLWQGDITTLDVDMIVNAANNRMLGCFVPGHRCIDNAIHRAAGPWLRAECAELMDAQGHLEPTGSVQVTSAHRLPSKWIAHTVGPIVSDGRPTPEQAHQLASCYRSCLDAARQVGARSIALCSVSTGVFGYPIDEAASIAVRTVLAWVRTQDSPGLRVVFNTFSDRDTAAYQRQLDEELS